MSDKNSGRDFLIGTGADISVIPPLKSEKHNSPCQFELFTANNSKIKTYGCKNITLDLGLQKSIRWIFIIADVQQPIIGSDLLKHCNLLIDIKNNKLVDNLTSVAISGKILPTSSITVKTISSITNNHLPSTYS